MGRQAEDVDRVDASHSHVSGVRHWIAVNTFAPRWLPGRLRRPGVSYLAAVAVEVIALAAVVLLVEASPHFQFPEALLLLALVLDALMWGAGPALLATVVGVLLLDLLIVPPIFSLALTHVEDAAGVGLVLIVGVTLSLVVGQVARTQREAMNLAHVLAGERARLAHAERAATAQANELQAIFDAMTDGVAVYDTEACLVRTNAAFRAAFVPDEDSVSQSMSKRLAQFAPRDATGQPLAPESATPLRLLRGEVLTGERAVDLVVRTLDGRDRDVSVAGAPVRDTEGRIVRAVTVVRDVTERRRLEQEVAARARELEAIIEAIADGVCVYDREGRIVRTNAAARALAMHGEDASDYFSRPLDERVFLTAFCDEQGQALPREQWPQLRTLAGEVLTGRDAQEIRTRALDGDEHSMSVSGGPLRDEAGQIIGADCIFHDVTARRQLEQRTRESLEALLAIAETLVGPVAGADGAAGAPSAPATGPSGRRPHPLGPGLRAGGDHGGRVRHGPTSSRRRRGPVVGGGAILARLGG